MNIHNPIVVIDEDQDDLRLLSDAHNDLGIRNPLITFECCEDVLPSIQKLHVRPLLIVCDYRFRTMNGLQLKKQLLEHRNSALSQIPFVIWSSVVEPSHVKLAKELAIQGFYLKPLTFVELQEIYLSIIKKWGHANTPCVLSQ
jgi:CheY-like chemotaxis protein